MHIRVIIKEKFFGRHVLADVSDSIKVVEADEYNQERGKFAFITTTSNGNQWTSGGSLSKDELRALRDALTDLLEDDSPLLALSPEEAKELAVTINASSEGE